MVVARIGPVPFCKIEETVMADRTNRNTDSMKPNPDLFPYFESILVVVVIAALGFILNSESVKSEIL